MCRWKAVRCVDDGGQENNGQDLQRCCGSSSCDDGLHFYKRLACGWPQPCSTWGPQQRNPGNDTDTDCLCGYITAPENQTCRTDVTVDCIDRTGRAIARRLSGWNVLGMVGVPHPQVGLT